ncbi:MAG: hypothetical protein AMXMBFR23_24010 [Chloroflexota bacterium]
MSIDPSGPAPLRPVHLASRRQQQAEPSAAAPAGRPEQHDRIDLSVQARGLAQAESPEVREARVRALREAVADGTYRVDPQDLAQRIADRGDDR